MDILRAKLGIEKSDQSLKSLKKNTVTRLGYSRQYLASHKYSASSHLC